MAKDKINHFCDRTSFIHSTVYVVHWDGLFQLDQVEVAAFSIVSVNEFSSCSTVYQTSDGLLLQSVHCLYFNFQFKGFKTLFCGCNEVLFRQYFFPFQFPYFWDNNGSC